MHGIPYDFKTDIGGIIKCLRSKGWIYEGCGSDYEPYSTKWCESLDKGLVGSNYCVIDWGCGYGRFLNYLLTKGVDRFKYYGFELHGERNGDLLMGFCKAHYLGSNSLNRVVKFGYVDDNELLDEALKNCDTILLGSVFTHMSIDDSLSFLKRFDSFVANGGAIVFSLILEKNVYELHGPGAYGIPNGYECVFHSTNELKQLCRNGRYKVRNLGSFQTDHTVKHAIIKLTSNI